MPLKPILLAALLAVAIDIALGFLPEGFMTRTLRLRAREIVERPAPTLQIMGDSVSSAIQPEAVAQALGWPESDVNNYSLPGTSPVFAYFTLRRQLAAGRQPKVIVFAPHPAHFNESMFKRFIGRFATLRETGEFAAAGAKFDDVLFGLACRASYTMRYREELYGVLTQGDREFFRTLQAPAISVAAPQIPYQPMPAPGSGRTFRENQLPPALLTGFSVDPLCGEFIDRFLRLAHAHRIPVLWVSMPSIAALNQRWERDGDFARLAVYLKELEQKHPNFVLLRPTMETWPDEYFVDARHLKRTPAWHFAELLGADLAAYFRDHPLPH